MKKKKGIEKSSFGFNVQNDRDKSPSRFDLASFFFNGFWGVYCESNDEAFI